MPSSAWKKKSSSTFSIRKALSFVLTLKSFLFVSQLTVERISSLRPEHADENIKSQIRAVWFIKVHHCIATCKISIASWGHEKKKLPKLVCLHKWDPAFGWQISFLFKGVINQRLNPFHWPHEKSESLDRCLARCDVLVNIFNWYLFSFAQSYNSFLSFSFLLLLLLSNFLLLSMTNILRPLKPNKPSLHLKTSCYIQMYTWRAGYQEKG